MTRFILPLLALALVLLPGCGADDGPGASDAVALAPRDTVALIELQSDLDSEQWQAVQALLDRFPDGDKVLGELTETLAAEGLSLEEDVDPALGERLVVVVRLRGEQEPDVVALTQPDDGGKLRRLVARADDELDLRDVGGWTAIGETGAITRYQDALDAGTLEGHDRYDAAAATFPDEALATAFVNGSVLEDLPGFVAGRQGLEWAALALTAEERGVRLAGTMKAADALETERFDEELLDEVPADALAVLAFGGGPELERQLETPGADALESALGLNLEAIASLFDEGGVLWVRPGLPIPEATLLLPGATVAELDELLQPLAAIGGGKVSKGQLGGAPATRVTLGPVTISYAEVDGRAVVTTARTLERPEQALPDSAAFGDAREAAGMPDETSGFLYVDLRRLVPLVEGLLGFSGEQVDDELSRNLRPLASALAYASTDGDEAHFAVFLEIR
jgi:hypothetical protein